MSHSITVGDTTFITDSDALTSGAPVMIVNTRHKSPEPQPTVEIAACDLVGFVAELVRRDKIDRLEQADAVQLLRGWEP